VIRQGEIYWLHFGPAEGSAPAGRRPALVVQHDRFNRSAISTTVVAAVTADKMRDVLKGLALLFGTDEVWDDAS